MPRPESGRRRSKQQLIEYRQYLLSSKGSQFASGEKMVYSLYSDHFVYDLFSSQAIGFLSNLIR